MSCGRAQGVDNPCSSGDDSLCFSSPGTDPGISHLRRPGGRNDDDGGRWWAWEYGAGVLSYDSRKQC